MLSPADQQRARELAATIDFTKSGIESTYARDAQRSMSDFADNVLAKTSNKATGEAGALLRELLADVGSAELSGVKQIPIIGKVVVGIDKLRRTYQKVAPQVDEVVEKLERAQAQMIADIAMYDTMYQRNVDQYRSLKVYIAAGRQALADFRAEQLPALEAEAASTGDAMGAQALKDFKDKLDRFDKRLDDLDRVSIVSLQMAPQIKLLQNADKSISDKIDTTISTTIPLWKSQMVIALGLANQRAALDLQNHVDDTTNKLLRANAEALQQGAVRRRARHPARQRGHRDARGGQQAPDRHLERDDQDPAGGPRCPRGRRGPYAPDRVRPEDRPARGRRPVIKRPGRQSLCLTAMPSSAGALSTLLHRGGCLANTPSNRPCSCTA